VKQIYAIILILLTLGLNLNAIEENNIKSVMSKKVDNILQIMQQKGVSKSTTAKQVFLLLDSVFDYKTMAKISLGKQWKRINKKEKEKFTKAFEKKLKYSYMDKLELYTDEKVLIKKLIKSKKNRIQLYSDLLGKTQKFEIIYKFHRNKKNDWLIYDIKIIGVSIIQTYRKEFSSYLQNHSIDSLINSL